MSGGRKSILLGCSQAMPARPSDKDRMRVKTLRVESSRSLKQKQQNALV
jgi:hypothetical protein